MDCRQKANPRKLAMKSLLAMERDGKYANLEISASLNRNALSDADRGLYTALVYGVIERSITLDYVLGNLSKRPVASLEREVVMACRIGLYQMIYMDRIPDHAAVSESVDLVEDKRRGFVNAILRSFLREGKKVILPTTGRAEKILSVKYSMPEEICTRLLKQYGEEDGEKILAASFAKEGNVTVRVNTLHTSMAEFMKKMPKGVVSPLSEDMLILPSAKEAFSSYDKECFVEDVSSRLAVKALGLQPGETFVDTCAAPGGKTFSAGIDMQNQGKIYAFDLHENKLSLVKRGAEKLGITVIETEARDARNPKESLLMAADAVLCDAPCSGWGVIGKKPDIKYKPMESVDALPPVQLAVLTGASKYVRVGGRLVYSTCTVNKRENEEVVESFLKEQPDFRLKMLPESIASGSMKTFLPGEGTDGFFIASMERVK